MNWYLLGGEVKESGENVREIVAKRSPRTVNQAVTAIQEFYTYHTIEGRIEEKHFTLLAHGWGKRGGFLRGIAKSNPDKRKRIKIKEPKLFSGCLLDEEVAALANACTTYRDRLIVMLLRSTGVRRGELLGLHLEDVKDLDFSGRIRIVRREDNPNRAMAKGREREIPIIYHRSAIQETFHAYLLEEYPPQAETLGGGMLFVNLSSKWVGQAMSLVRLNKLFDQLHKRTGIKGKRKHQPISIHQTLNGTLRVNWKTDYAGEFICPQCNQGQLNRFSYSKGSVCKLRLGCDFCHQVTYLTGQLQHLPISIHQTLQGTLSVNWAEKYSGEFICPQCNQGQISKFHYADGQSHQLKLGCNSCSQKTQLCCQVPPQFHGYQKHLVCPNPLCHQIGPDGQKGWIYETFQTTSSQSNCRCYFCHINFHPNATSYGSWVGYQQEETLLNFCFDDDVWDFRHFIKNSPVRILNFKSIKPEWFRVLVKQYLYSLLKSGRFSASAKPMNSLVALRQFSQILKLNNIQHLPEIKRELILSFLDLNQTNCNRTIREKLYILKDFFDFVGLESLSLVRHRDIPKHTIQDVDWLDEITRQGIKQHLNKIPAPIAHHYLVQEYTAARPGDICQIAFDCLVEENGQWYIKFYQHKVERWHRLPASREIRQVIEQQQQWIRKTFGSDYPYLFCHFRSIKQSSYPSFSSLKPLPKPPQVTANENPMVRLIRLLIEREDIRDSNGTRPYFTGKITRASRLQEVRAKHGMEAAQLYADHLSSKTTFQHYAPPTKEQVAAVDLPFQELLLNSQNRFLPWQSLPESLLKNPSSHELDLEISPRLVVYGHCTLDPKTNCIYNLYPKCYGCGSFRPSTSKLPLYERQYAGEHKRMESAKQAGAALAYEESKATLEAMDEWLSDLRKVANGEAT